MPLEIRGAHFLIRSAQLVRGTRLEQALAGREKSVGERQTADDRRGHFVGGPRLQLALWRHRRRCDRR